MNTKGLSPRQAEIAELAIRGLQNKHIAHRLGISMGTVKINLVQIYLKMNVSNRTALAAMLMTQEGSNG